MCLLVKLSLRICLHVFMYACVYKCVGTCAVWPMCGGQRIIWGELVLTFRLQVLGGEFGLPGLASDFTHGPSCVDTFVCTLCSCGVEEARGRHVVSSITLYLNF